MEPGLLVVFILGIFVQGISSNEEIFTELDKVLEQIPRKPVGPTYDVVGGFVSFNSLTIDKVGKGRGIPLDIEFFEFDKKFSESSFSVGKYTTLHYLSLPSVGEAEDYILIGTVDKDAPSYVKFALIQTKVIALPKGYDMSKNVLDPNSLGSLMEDIRRAESKTNSACTRNCYSMKFKRKVDLNSCLNNNCHDKQRNFYNNLKYRMSLEVKETLRKKFESPAFRTQILNYFNKGEFQIQNIFKILKTEVEKLQTKEPENLSGYVLGTKVLINYVSDVTRKGDYSKYNLDNQIKSQLEMLQFTSQVDLKAFNFEAQLSTGEYEQVIGVGVVAPNDQNLVHLTFFQARARSKLRQQYNYPYPYCTKYYYKSSYERIDYLQKYSKLFQNKSKYFMQQFPVECFKEERGFLPSEILIIKTGMKSRVYRNLKEKIERVYQRRYLL